ncbi:MAG: glycine zipper domain-containing protein [Rhizobiaceae bacterium]
MRKMIIVAAASMAVLAGCTTAERTAAVGAGVGAGVGAIATGTIEGAAVGSLVGAVGGYLVGRASDRPGQCQYRRPNGQIFYDRCPGAYN